MNPDFHKKILEIHGMVELTRTSACHGGPGQYIVEFYSKNSYKTPYNPTYFRASDWCETPESAYVQLEYILRSDLWKIIEGM